MGVPDRDHQTLKQWCGYRAALGWGRPAAEDQVEIATNLAAYRKYLRDPVDAKAEPALRPVGPGLAAGHRWKPRSR